MKSISMKKLLGLTLCLLVLCCVGSCSPVAKSDKSDYALTIRSKKALIWTSNLFWNQYVVDAPYDAVDFFGNFCRNLNTANDVNADGFDSSPIDQ